MDERTIRIAPRSRQASLSFPCLGESGLSRRLSPSRGSGSSFDGHQTADLRRRLRELNPRLLRSFDEAIESLSCRRRSGGNFGARMCETLLGVLSSLAPDDAVCAWSREPDLFSATLKPTRRARLLYIHRHIDDSMLVDCIENDVEQLLVYVAGQSVMGDTDGAALGEPAREFLRLKFEQVLTSLLVAARQKGQ